MSIRNIHIPCETIFAQLLQEIYIYVENIYILLSKGQFGRSVLRFDCQPKLPVNTNSEIDHEIFSTVILSLPLIQEGQLSVSGERMCTVLVNRLED